MLTRASLSADLHNDIRNRWTVTELALKVWKQNTTVRLRVYIILVRRELATVMIV